MSDDVWAPHEWQFLVQPRTTLGELIQIAIDEHYLANITGGRAAWVAEAGTRPATLLAVVAQQWPQVGWLADPTQSLVDVPGAYDPERQRAELYPCGPSATRPASRAHTRRPVRRPTLPADDDGLLAFEQTADAQVRTRPGSRHHER